VPETVSQAAAPELFEAFTPESVNAILSRVLKVGGRPATGSAVVENLTRALNITQREARNSTAEWRGQLEAIDAAIQTLTTVLPQHLRSYTPVDGGVTDDVRLGPFITLALAARYADAARQRGLPFVDHRPPVEAWTDTARDLMQIFKALLPKQTKEAGYRFVVEVTPLITGDAPTFHAVKTALKRGRLSK
jgi:hypothetical protein